MDESDLDQKIVSVVNQVWTRHRTPILLSELGLQDGNAISTAVKSLGFQLRFYIETHLREQLRLIRHSTKRPMYGVVPRIPEADSLNVDAALEQAAAGHLKAKAAQAHSGAPSQHPKPNWYAPRFWFAFLHEIPNGQRRFAITGPPAGFIDLDPTVPAPPGAIEIDLKFIVPLDRREDRTQIHQSINDWATEAGASLDNYVFRAADPRSNERMATYKSECLLSAILDAIPEEHLKRIAIPLDIVSILYRKKIG